MRRADLATPKGIDHDYNYLTSLEREIDRADRDATDRGIVLDEDTSGDKNTKVVHPQKGEVPLQQALERSGVVIARAPKGMSRARANKTQWRKKRHCVMWSVEWVHPDGSKEIGECFENQAIEAAYEEAFGPKEEHRPRKKRRMEKREAESKEQAQVIGDLAGAEPEVQLPETTRQEGSTLPAAESLPAARITPDAPEAQFAEPSSTIAPSIEEDPSTSGPVSPTNRMPPPPNPSATSPDIPLRTQTVLNFYLHAPSLPSRHPVLIPLEKGATLSASLKHRLVLEFPTIYVFKSEDGDPHKIPEGFVSEGKFFTQASTLLVEEIEDGEVAEKEVHTEEVEKGRLLGQRDFNAEGVLRVLGQDLKGFG